MVETFVNQNMVSIISVLVVLVGVLLVITILISYSMTIQNRINEGWIANDKIVHNIFKTNSDEIALIQKNGTFRLDRVESSIGRLLVEVAKKQDKPTLTNTHIVYGDKSGKGPKH